MEISGIEITPSKPMNALDKLNDIIDNPQTLQMQYSILITSNPYLADELKVVSSFQFIKIITNMRNGILEAMKCKVDGKKIGKDAISSDVVWVQGMIQGNTTSKIGYQKHGDRVLVTATGIAELADSESKGLGYHYDKLDGAIVGAGDLALLLMAEEASHRYDVQVRGYEFSDSSLNRDHPVENNSKLIVRQIVDRLHIKTY